MTIYDVDHYTDEDRVKLIESWPKHQRDARAKGIPMMGEGRVFPFEDEQVITERKPIPDYWARILGIDFGYNHPFAAIELCHDADYDILYVTKCYRQSEASPLIHSAAIKPWGDWIPVAWPHDGHQHDKGGSNEQLAKQYETHGLNMLDSHATHEAGGYGTEAGVMEMYQRIETGRLKVFDDLLNWMSEFRMYHRKKGVIVREKDDLMSATRMAVMMLRSAERKPTPFEGRLRPNLGRVTT